jgi:hypothetical protein
MNSAWPPLIHALTQAACYPHPVTTVAVIETHISWVLLTGRYAYKIKKPVNLGFLDFSSLEQRRHYCEEELRLNQRLAPSLYMEVVPISGTLAAPRMQRGTAVLDYAVRMRQLPAAAQFSELLSTGRLPKAHLQALAAYIAAFHDRAPRAAPGSPWGEPAALRQPVDDNFAALARCPASQIQRETLAGLQQWCNSAFQRLTPAFNERKAGGWVREGHGDLHLGNIAWMDGAPLAFDCIEFDPGLRWSDVMSDLAFLLMDLERCGQTDLAALTLDAYLTHSGDYDGITVLRYYQIYRALVRAKINAIQSSQPGLTSGQRRALAEACHDYVQLAARLSQPPDPVLILTHGLPGSGKSHLAELLLTSLPATRLRSDVERKRLAGLGPSHRVGDKPGEGLYTFHNSERTYQMLAERAEGLLRAGWPVIVDAAFLEQKQRAAFLHLGRRLNLPCLIVEMQTPLAELRRRVQARACEAKDASDAGLPVLEYLLPRYAPLTGAEQKCSLVVDGTQPPDGATLAGHIRALASAFRNRGGNQEQNPPPHSAQ